MQDNHAEESCVHSFPLIFDAPSPFFKWISETTGVELVLREIFNYFKMFFNLRLIPLRSVVLINVLSGYSAVQRRHRQMVIFLLNNLHKQQRIYSNFIETGAVAAEDS